jgi:hypothetical protein
VNIASLVIQIPSKLNGISYIPSQCLFLVYFFSYCVGVFYTWDQTLRVTSTRDPLDIIERELGMLRRGDDGLYNESSCIAFLEMTSELRILSVDREAGDLLSHRLKLVTGIKIGEK